MVFILSQVYNKNKIISSIRKLDIRQKTCDFNICYEKKHVSYIIYFIERSDSVYINSNKEEKWIIFK